MKRYSDTMEPSGLPILTAGAIAIGVALIFVTNLFGLWWVTTIVGVLVGLLPWPGRRVFGAAALAGAAGWAVGLIWLEFQESVNAAASVVAGIMGFGSHASVVILLTLLLGALLSLAGSWLGLAVRGVAEARFGDPYGQL